MNGIEQVNNEKHIEQHKENKIEFPTIEEINEAIDKFKPFVLDQINKSSDGIVRTRVQDLITELGPKFNNITYDQLLEDISDRLKSVSGQKEEELLVVEGGTHKNGDKILIFSRPNMFVGWKGVQDTVGCYIRDMYTDTNYDIPTMSDALISAKRTIEQMEKDLADGEPGNFANIYDLGVDLVKIDMAFRKEQNEEVKIRLWDLKKISKNIKDAIEIIQGRLGSATIGLEIEVLRDVLLRLDRADGTIERIE